MLPRSSRSLRISRMEVTPTRYKTSSKIGACGGLVALRSTFLCEGCTPATAPVVYIAMLDFCPKGQPACEHKSILKPRWPQGSRGLPSRASASAGARWLTKILGKPQCRKKPGCGRMQAGSLPAQSNALQLMTKVSTGAPKEEDPDRASERPGHDQGARK